MRFFKKAMDPVSSETHFIGAVLCSNDFIRYIRKYEEGTVYERQAVKSSDFLRGEIWVPSTKHEQDRIASIIKKIDALYSASCLYHYYNANEDNKIKLILRKLDHSMIYVLIAGTYTPICLSYLEYPHSIYFLAAIWAIACVGIIIKLFWMNAPRFISTIFYLLMGWALIFDLPAFSKVPLGCLGLIACGGISYTIGAIVYIVKKPNWFKTFGFHELFHIFVMIGSAFHFLAVIIYILL